MQPPSPNLTATTVRHPSRIPSLDGLRALSIGMVLFAHLLGTRNFPLATSPLTLPLGGFGVRVFFVISGFLITSLLLHELEQTGRVHLVRFYFRRTLRIFPPYYVLVGVVTVAAALHWLQLLPGDIAHALTYTTNYHRQRGWYLGHTWSLGVEEQFYLLWPATVFLAGRRRGLLFAAAVLLVCPMWRAFIWLFHPAAQLGIGETFESTADCLAVGCLLAGSRAWLHGQAWYTHLCQPRRFWLVPLATLVLVVVAGRPKATLFLGETLLNLGVALCLDWCVTYPTNRVGRFLNTRPMVFIGVMSYSIYLWQQIFLNRNSPALAASFPLNLGLMIATALASYFLVEQPSLRFRQRWEKRLFARSEGVEKRSPSASTIQG